MVAVGWIKESHPRTEDGKHWWDTGCRWYWAGREARGSKCLPFSWTGQWWSLFAEKRNGNGQKKRGSRGGGQYPHERNPKEDDWKAFQKVQPKFFLDKDWDVHYGVWFVMAKKFRLSDAFLKDVCTGQFRMELRSLYTLTSCLISSKVVLCPLKQLRSSKRFSCLRENRMQREPWYVLQRQEKNL